MTKETIVLVHGTFASPNADSLQWYQRKHKFREELDAALEQVGSPARCWAHLNSNDAQVVEFYWDGENSWLSRSRAAAELRQLLWSLSQDGWRSHVVAHSHGGNVVLEALNYHTFGYPTPESGPPGWFNGKVVLLGTPILQINPQSARVSEIFNIAAGVGTMLCWGWAVWVAFGDRLMHLYPSSQTFYASLGWFVLLAFVALLAAVFGTWYWQIGRPASREEDFNLPVREQLLILNSPRDEAFNLLRAAQQGANPFEKPKNERMGFWARLKALHAASIFDARKRDWVLFACYPPSFWIAVLSVGMMASAVSIALFGWLSAVVVPWILADVLVSGLILLFAVSCFDSNAFRSAFYLHVRAFLWAYYYCAGVIVGMIRGWMEWYWRRKAWSVIQHHAFGLLGSPYHVKDVTLVQSPKSIESTLFTFAELPNEVEEEAQKRRREYVHNHVGSLTDLVFLKDYSLDHVEKKLHDLMGLELLHSCYFSSSACLQMIADWIAMPAEYFPSQWAASMNGQTMSSLRASYRDHVGAWEKKWKGTTDPDEDVAEPAA